MTPKGRQLNTGRTHFKKGQTPWNKDKKGVMPTPWNKGKNLFYSVWNKGKKIPELSGENNPAKRLEVREKISKAMKGKKHSEEHKRRNSEAKKKNPTMYWLGRKRSKEDVEKISKNRTGKCLGEENCNWNNGSSFLPYSSEFNSTLKLKIRTRDNFTCCLCGRTEREELEEFNRVLSVNHINFNKNDCREENLNTLCLRCNVKINRERDYWTDYFNQRL